MNILRAYHTVLIVLSLINFDFLPKSKVSNSRKRQEKNTNLYVIKMIQFKGDSKVQDFCKIEIRSLLLITLRVTFELFLEIFYGN